MVNIKQIKEILDVYDSARIQTWLNICSKCGLCAESCFVYLGHDKDPKMSPAYKVKRTLGEMYRQKGNVTREFLEGCFDTLWLHCTLCKRCSLYCPFGIDIATMMSLARRVCNSQGVLPEKLAFFTDNCKKSGNHMALPIEDFQETCEWMADEASEEIKGVTIPFDKPNAKYMYTINPREPVFYPQDIAMAAKIFTIVGESWTMPSYGWDCTNLPMFAGDYAVAGQVVKGMYDKAIELGAEKILITECGHAYRSVKYEGPYFAGYPDGKPPVEIVHYVQWLYELLRDGKIRIDPAKKIKEPVTYQDPCNVSRNGGLWDEPRKIISYLCEDFRDMSPNKDYNHCCGGGGGIMPMGPDYRPGRMITGKVKADQIKATGAKIVISPCHNCFDQIRDLGEKYELGIKVVCFKELLLETMIIPDNFKAE